MEQNMRNCAHVLLYDRPAWRRAGMLGMLMTSGVSGSGKWLGAFECRFWVHGSKDHGR